MNIMGSEMMWGMRRALSVCAISVALVTCGAVVAGCSKSNEVHNNGAAGPRPATSVPEPVTVQLPERTPDERVFDEAIAAYLSPEGRAYPRRYLDLFEVAAERGYSPAATNLGAIYLTGDGVEQNVQTALQWYARSAELGDPDGYRHLGYLPAFNFVTGEIDTVDDAVLRQSAEHFGRALGLGDVVSGHLLIRILLHAKDFDAARTAFTRVLQIEEHMPETAALYLDAVSRGLLQDHPELRAIAERSIAANAR